MSGCVYLESPKSRLQLLPNIQGGKVMRYLPGKEKEEGELMTLACAAAPLNACEKGEGEKAFFS